ncbi:aminoimidazole riboside kinase [Bacillus timonensis]|nr:aminoimidazole riboside kinase [Bacillus timonensis]
MKNGVISLGEALIDFIPLDENNLTYQKSPGGAPANVAVGVARLNTPSTFVGKVGNDVLGTFLKETLTSYGVNTTSMLQTNEAKTGVVFITLGQDGERSFDFYINPPADQFLHKNDLKEEWFESNKILHFGSISLIHEPVKAATIEAVKLAKKHGMIVSYDPNLRLGLWDNDAVAKDTIKSMLTFADVLKLSEEELEFLTGEKDIESGVAKLKEMHDIPFLLITLGAEGSYVYTASGYERVSAMKIDAVDTTGAGDAFVSGILYSVNKHIDDIHAITLDQAAAFARFASVSGGLAASTKGAMTALPTIDQVNELLSKN